MKNGQDDFVAQGFHKLDSKLITALPPKIKWGEGYRASTDAEKVTYLEKLAATMNHAAFLIQNERNALGELCEKKEQQLVKMKEAMDANNNMIQQQVTRMNEQRNAAAAHVSKLNKKIRELEAN